MDKKFWQSKKFIAFFFAMIVMAAVVVAVVYAPALTLPTAIVASLGMLGITFLGIAYVKSVAVLDKFIVAVGKLGGFFNGNNTEHPEE